MKVKERILKEREAFRLWLAQCDAHLDGARAIYEWTRASCFVTGTVYDDRRVTVHVGWDSKGSYVWGGSKYRLAESHNRPQGTLVLELA